MERQEWLQLLKSGPMAESKWEQDPASVCALGWLFAQTELPEPTRWERFTARVRKLSGRVAHAE